MSNLVSTSTVATATYTGGGNMVCVASDGTALVIYYDGTEMAYRSAASPYSSWSSATTLPGSGSNRYNASAHINGDDTVDVLYHVASGIPTYVKLTKSGSTWTTGTSVTVASSGASGSSGEAIQILKDGSGRLWALLNLTNTTWEAYYSTDGVTWTASTTTETQATATISPYGAIVGSGRYFLVCWGENTNGDMSWTRLDTTGSLTTWATTQKVQLGNAGGFGTFWNGDLYGLAVDGNGNGVAVWDDSPLNFNAGINGAVYNPTSDTWTHYQAIQAAGGAAGDGGVSVVADGSGDVYAFWAHYNAANSYALNYVVWNHGTNTWGSVTTLIAAGSNITNPVAGYGNSTIGIAHTVGTATPWDVEFDALSTASGASHTTSGALANLKVHNTHTASGALGNLKVHNAPKSSGAAVEIARIPPLAPVISRGQPAYASDITYPPSNANDSNYGTIWVTGNAPSVGTPAYWAVDLSGVPSAERQQVVLAWYNETADGYWLTSGTYNNQPRDYTIQTNTAAGGSYPASGWTTVATVTGNIYWTREHAFNLAGANWVQIVVTASNGSSPNNGVAFQVDVHDAHRGDYDDWLILGDSITAEAWFRRDIDGTAWTNGPIPQQTNTSNPIYFPLMIDGGFGGMTMAWAATNVSSLIAPFTGHYVAIQYGTNDLNQGFEMSTSQIAAVYANLLTVLDAVVAAGHVPVVSYTPYGYNNNGYLGINAQQFNAYVDAHLPSDRAGQYLRGPDLYTPFYNNQGLLRDGIHPTYSANVNGTQTGYDLYHRVWRDWLLATIYQTPHQYHTASGALAYLSVTGGKTHNYHSATGALAQIGLPNQHTTSGAVANIKRLGVSHTSSGALTQVERLVAHTASGVLVGVQQLVKHQSSGAQAQVKQHATHRSSGALAQLAGGPLVSHTASGVLVQLLSVAPVTAATFSIRSGAVALRTR